MIQLRELRIDNWVMLAGGTGVPFQINAKSFCRFTRGIETDYEPIPLSPSVLEDCGFDYDYDHAEKWFSSDIGYLGKCEGGYSLIDSDGENSLAYVLQSLHQLQNLFFALTGTELIYKPKK